MRKSYTSTFKAQVVLELLKEEKTLTRLASDYGVHPNLLRDWKTIALKALPTAFERRDSLEAARQTHEQQVQELYAEIGRLTTQVTWLKKKLGL
jgi:putative transposase